MKHLLSTLLFTSISAILLGFAAGMIVQNNLTGLWYNFGRIEDACLIIWIPFAWLAYREYKKHCAYIEGLKDDKMIKSIKVD